MDMKRFMDSLVWIVSIFALVAIVIGCGKAKEAAQETAVEKAIEAAASKDGQKVDVDLKKGTMEVTTKDGASTAKVDTATGSVSVTSNDGNSKVAFGEGATIPEDFPKDVPVYAGAKVIGASSDKANKQHMVQLETADAVLQVAEKLKADATTNGWTEDTNMNTTSGDNPMAMMTYTKGERKADYMVMKQNDKTSITVSTTGE